MEWVSRALSFAMDAANKNAVINVFLLGSFTALSIRSVNQQNNIKTLETEKVSMLKTNKALKQTMWDWKQQLFAEASDVDSALVPLARLKAIYGEAPTSQFGVQGDAAKEDAKSPDSKFVV